MQPSFARKLSLHIRKTNVNTQKIDNSGLKIFDIVITSFLVEDKDKKFCFFEKIFLLADISMDVALGMLFLNLSNVEVNFVNWKLKWRL